MMHDIDNYHRTPAMTRNRKTRLVSFLFWICFMGLVPVNLAGCEQMPFSGLFTKDLDLIRVSPSEYPLFDDDMNFEGLTESMGQSLSYLNIIPENRKFVFGEDVFDAHHMQKSIAHFTEFIETRPSAETLNQFIAKHYRVYRSKGRDRKKQVLFTGYFEPILKGSPVQTGIYKYPIYSRPDDLVTIDRSFYLSEEKKGPYIGRLSGRRILPYLERKEIEKDPLFSEKARPLAWVSDRVQLFFLHVQGSGKVTFPNGDFIRVQYDISNGRPYQSIGQYLIDRKKISVKNMSMQAIEDYLKNHPEEIQPVLNYNPSYIFFKKTKDGPYGSIQAKLVPGRAIASDRHIFPLSALAYIETQKPLVDPSGRIENWVPLSRFVLNQDTGSAIKGPGRVDLFWGSGQYAEMAAGHLKHTGTLYFLVLDPDLT